MLGLVLALSLVLLSNIAYAKPFTEGFDSVLIKVNDFFGKEQYKAYSKTIDFIVFALIFIAIYMRGVKFAFKEINKTEKLLAVILGLTTAFLMVIGDFSIVALLPFVNWFLYFLLFALIWWLLKDMKSKFWRFLLALALTLLLLLLSQLLFSGVLTGLSCPEKALPWLNWLIAILIFILLMFLLKDINNVFGRFVLALLLTITIVLLIIFLLKSTSIEKKCPEVQSAFAFVDDFTDSLKGIDVGSFSPSTPQFLSELTLRQVVPPSVPSLQQVETPGSRKAEDKVDEDKGSKKAAEPGLTIAPDQEAPPKDLKPIIDPPKISDSRTGEAGDVQVSQAGPGNLSGSSWIGIVLFFIILFYLGKKEVKKWKEKRKGKEKTVQEILSKIEEVSKNKKELIAKLAGSQKRKETLVLAHDEITAFLRKIADEREQGEIYWYEEEEKLGEERGSVGGLNEMERRWISETRELVKLETDFIRSLREWRVGLKNINIDIDEEYCKLEPLIVRAKDSILVFLLQLYGKEAQLEHTEEELLHFLDKKYRSELIREKHKFLKDADIVKLYVKEEGRIIGAVGEKIQDQNKLLAQLDSKIREAVRIGVSRRKFLAGGIAAGLATGATALAQEAPPKNLKPNITAPANGG